MTATQLFPNAENSSARQSFDIRNFTDHLTQGKGKDRYVCPVCGGNDMTIKPETGEYQCWHGCECRDIREAIKPWDKVLSDRPLRSRKPKPLSPAPIPSGTPKLAKQPSLAELPQKRKRGNQTEIEYPYSETQWVVRIEKQTDNAKGYEKITIPYHLNTDGESVKGRGNAAWNLYRLDEVTSHSAGKWVVGVEGESCTETVRYLGLVGFTLQGSAWTEDDLTRAMLQIKSTGALGVVYFPDHDKTGYQKAQKMAIAAAKAQLPFIQLNPLDIWADMPDKGDIADWVKWGLAQKMDREEFIRRLEEEIHAAVAARIKEQKANDPDERLKLELKELLKESDPIKRMRRRSEIASHYRLKASDIEQALKYLDESSKAQKPRQMDLEELFDLHQAGVEYLIPGMLPVGETVLLVADPKAGKSLLAYDAAFAIATGESNFLGEQTGQGKVLIVQCDESINTAKGRLIKRGFRREDKNNVRFVDSFNINQLDTLEEWLESFRPSLVIIDSLRRINAGGEVSENSAEFADTIYRLKELLTRYNAAGILIHHSNKNQDAVGIQRVRGSTAIAGAVWGIWQMDHIAKSDPNNKKRMIVDPKDLRRTFSIIARDTEGQRLRIELDPENNHWLNLGEEGVEETETKERKTQADQILELLKRVSPLGLQAREIQERLGIGQGIYSVLNRMLEQRIIGSRPSSKDARRTIYYYPKNEGDTPPPPPTDPNVIEKSETVDVSTLQSSITNRTQIDHTRSHQDIDTEVEQPSIQDTSVVSEFDHIFDSQGGSGCAASVSEVTVGTNFTLPLPEKSSGLANLTEEPRRLGKRVFVYAEFGGTPGEGTVVKDRGYGSSRMLEVRMDDGKLQSALSLNACRVIMS
jgi:hypothetical protein